MISTILGLIIQPFLRSSHPFRKEIKGVIKHVEMYIQKAISEGRKPGELARGEGENALARAIYEYCIRTFESAETFTARVNEQIRFFYFYYFISVALKVGLIGILLVLSLKAVDLYTNLLKSSPLLEKVIRNEFLLGIQDIIFLIIITGSYAFLSLFLARKFYATAKGIILNELDTRHVFILAQKERIQEMANLAREDEVLLEIFKKTVDKEEGLRR